MDIEIWISVGERHKNDDGSVRWDGLQQKRILVSAMELGHLAIREAGELVKVELERMSLLR